MADKPTEEVPADLVPFRDAPRQQTVKAVTFKEKLATLGADDAAEEAVVEVAVSCTQPAAKAAQSAEVVSYVALLLR